MHRHMVSAAIVIFWLGMMSALMARHYDGPAGKPVSRTGIVPSAVPQEEWFGIYLKNRKIGYSHRGLKKKGDGYQLTDVTKMKIDFFGTGKDVETETSALLTPDFRLASFDVRVRADSEVNIKGRTQGRNLLVSLDTGGSRSRLTIPLRDRPFLNASVIPALISRGTRPGTRISVNTVDPLTFTQARLNMKVEGRELLTVMGRQEETVKLKGTIGDVTFLAWLSEKGEILKEKSPLGVVLVRETREEALTGGPPPADIVKADAVPFNMKLPRDIHYLKLRLSGIDLRGLAVDGGRQRLRGNILEIREEDLSGTKDNGSSPKRIEKTDKVAPGMRKYLRQSAFIQSGAPAIVSLAKKIAGKEQRPLRVAQLLNTWVYRNISDEPSLTIPVATKVLKTRKGDCNEHAVLFAALARAAGIPARVAIGLVYDNGYLYYHAWPEIFIGRWIAVDPTLGQFPADASHIRLLAGDMGKQMQIVGLMGKIRVHGLAFRQ